MHTFSILYSGPIQNKGILYVKNTHDMFIFLFHQICTFLNGATVELIEDQMVPFATKGNEWVGYDNRESFEIKVRYRIT